MLLLYKRHQKQVETMCLSKLFHHLPRFSPPSLLLLLSHSSPKSEREDQVIRLIYIKEAHCCGWLSAHGGTHRLTHHPPSRHTNKQHSSIFRSQNNPNQYDTELNGFKKLRIYTTAKNRRAGTSQQTTLKPLGLRVHTSMNALIKRLFIGTPGELFAQPACKPH